MERTSRKKDSPKNSEPIIVADEQMNREMNEVIDFIFGPEIKKDTKLDS